MSGNGRAAPTVALVNELYARGVRRMLVLLRHGARMYDSENLQNEPYMPLTAEGKQQAYEFGLALPDDVAYRFFSSVAGRCIETAYQIEKGCIKRGAETKVNEVVAHLVPEFILDYDALYARCAEEGAERVFEAWLKGNIGEELLMHPEVAVVQQLTPMVAALKDRDGACIDVCVTHDCNISLVRHQCVGHAPEEACSVDYLEGIVLFRDSDALFVADHLGPPKDLSLFPKISDR